MVAKFDINVNFEGLDKLRQQIIQNSGYEVRVGIMGSKVARQIDNKSGVNNAEIGVIQEYGSQKNNIPARSFLRVPLQNGKKELSSWLKKQDLNSAVLEKGGLKKILAKLGFIAEGLVDDAFESRGGGQWPANKAATIKRKGSSAPLIDFGELRRSITSKVTKK